MEHPVAQHIEVGKIGEDIACKYLKSKGYKIIERNFRRKWGEIDIVCKKRSGIFSTNNAQVIHRPVLKRILSGLSNVLCRTNDSSTESILEDKIVFVEVKTLKGGNLNPEDNVTLSKQKKLIRTCELYLADKKFGPDTDWQIDVVAIRLDRGTNKADINHIENAVYYS
jgi:putative endonuclease